ncbi:MAG: IS30 family transposase [Candidatus Synoicihabitans palmerolidicus]|nr:IS30 family transposase [Candidatus Synoicihabitans palmerolidicus]
MAKIQRRITAKEREAMHAGLAQGKSGAQLTAALGRDASVVNREITRNGGRNSYSGMDAQTRACRRPKCAVRNKVADTPAFRDEVLALFATGATPKQIEVALRRRHGLDLTRRVSHDTNLRLHLHPLKGSVKKELIAYLRRKKPRRSPAPPPAKGKLSGQLPGALNIGERPAEVERREVPGYWEADLVMGASNRTAILVITERVSRYVMIVPLGGAKNAISVARTLIRAFKRLPAHLRKTLTYDNGREMAQHAAFSLATKVAVYCCNPHSPWPRGAVANINGLIREYFPKVIDFHTVTKGPIAKAEWLLNNLPRIGLDGQSPAEVFHAIIIQKNCALAA